MTGGAPATRPGFRPRVARTAHPAWNVTKTLLQASAMWTVFFVALPAAVFAAEDALGLARFRFDPAPFRTAALVVFCVLGTIGLATGAMLAILGDGTPLPLDTARRLVVRGPYRHVRNPMAMTSLGQGLAVGVWLGSPAVLVYACAGIVVWDCVARPFEEADLLERFGESYERYRMAVRCWVPRLRPYDPGSV